MEVSATEISHEERRGTATKGLSNLNRAILFDGMSLEIHWWDIIDRSVRTDSSKYPKLRAGDHILYRSTFLENIIREYVTSATVSSHSVTPWLAFSVVRDGVNIGTINAIRVGAAEMVARREHKVNQRARKTAKGSESEAEEGLDLC